MTSPVPHHDGMAAIAETYDGFVLDVWGVIHDGVKLYPGVVDTLERLTAAGKRFVMLTNAPRRSAAVAEGMVAMGMPERFCTRILSSGEATFVDLKERSDPFYAGLGNRCLHIGPDRDAGLFDGIVDSPRCPPFWGAGAMDRRIVAGEPQRQRVADAAGDCDIGRRRLARRLRKLCLLAGERRPVGSEGHFQIRLGGDRPHAADHSALERLGRPFYGLCLDVVRTGHGVSP